MIVGGASAVSLTVGALSGSSAALITGGTVGSSTLITSFSSGTSTYAGAITDGAGGALAFTKSGGGTLALTGSSSFTGATTVTAGTLVINGTSASSAVTVQSGATLGGSGVVGNLTVSSGGTLAPGNSPGIISTGSFSLASGGVLSMELTGSGSPVAGTNYDQVNVAGTVTLSGSLALTLTSYTHVNNTVFFLINNDGGDSVIGLFSNATSTDPSVIFSVAGQMWQINYNADSASTTSGNFTQALGNDVALMAIPEPSSVLLGGIGITMSLYMIRRRRRA